MDGPTVPSPKDPNCGPALIEEGKVKLGQEATILYPPQWIQCDLRYLDMTVLGNK